MRSRPGYFVIVVSHYHEGDRSPCESEQYHDLTWGEVLDVVLANAEQYRPGTSPGGWEQLSLSSQPSWSSSTWSGELTH